ncbi:hypothetical protein ACRALDRAFT_210014 [Sodiomyces alcalophilus JCM 7366]|uniref:uncharacterized protein n=1 Tax=Sodiomyces alcalophilus JCM 7366 TaxID=591952 RepID=UPI0039B5783D
MRETMGPYLLPQFPEATYSLVIFGFSHGSDWKELRSDTKIHARRHRWSSYDSHHIFRNFRRWRKLIEDQRVHVHQQNSAPG